MTSPPYIPLSVDQITAAWLTDVLRAAGHSVTVSNCEHVAVVGGNATKVRVRVSYRPDDANHSVDLPEHLCVKVGMELQDPSKNLTGSTYDIEGRFYAEVAPLFQGLPVPRCVAVRIDAASSRCALVMEDLISAGAVFGSPLNDALTPAQVEPLLRQLARIHAAWWDDTRSMPIAGLEVGIDPANRLGRYYSTFDVAHVGELVDGSRGMALPAPLRDPELLVDGFWSYAATTVEHPLSVIHADPHCGNIFIASDGRCGIADWQTLRWGPWSHDVAYLVTSAMDVDERARNDMALLDAYLDALAAAGAPAPERNEARLAFRRSLMYGLFGWLTAPPYFGYSEDYSNRYVSRFAAAVLDHGTIGILEEMR